MRNYNENMQAPVSQKGRHQTHDGNSVNS